MFYSQMGPHNTSHYRALYVKWGHNKCVSELQAQLLLRQTRGTTLSHCFPAWWQIRWYENHLRQHPPGLNKWKVKTECFDFCSYNCDPGERAGSLPSFVDKLPNRFPVFSSLLDMNFPRPVARPRLWPHFHTGHFTRDATPERASCGWFQLERSAVQHDAYMAEHAQTVEFLLVLSPPEIFVSGDKWRTALRNNVFWTFDWRGSG